jgi:hypothetical protein
MSPADCYDGITMNLLSIIIILLAIAAAGGIIYAAWELSSDKPRPGDPGNTDSGSSGGSSGAAGLKDED